MRKLEIALAMLRQGDDYLLQQRGNIPEIGGAGLIGCFGGKIESNETPAHAVAREVKEEVSIDIETLIFQRIGRVKVISDHKLEAVSVTAEVYLAQVPTDANVSAKEGELVRLPLDQIQSQMSFMTTGTRQAFLDLVLPVEAP
jgi:8-oxo-dGTP pyrophosphatase MutT (NUDIX family)